MRSTTDAGPEDDQVTEDDQARDAVETDDVETDDAETDDAELDDAELDDAELEDETDDESSGGDAEPRARRPLGVAFVGIAVALVIAISGGIAWVVSAGNDDVARADQRDAVLIAAKQNIATLNSLDYRRIPADLEEWKDASAGTLRDQFTALDPKETTSLADAGAISTGKVVDAAVTRLDGSTAEVIASVETTIRNGKDAEAEPAVKRNRFSAELTRSGGTWKVSRLDQVAVDVS